MTRNGGRFEEPLRNVPRVWPPPCWLLTRFCIVRKISLPSCP